MRATFVGRLFARLGRFAISALATVAFFVSGIGLMLLTSLTGRVYPMVAFVVASACAVAVFLLFDRFDLLPDDPSDPPTGLGLGSCR